jgi:hypothetical protein
LENTCCNLTSEILVNRAPAEYAIGYKMLRLLHEITTPDGPFDEAAFETRIVWEDYAHYLALMTIMAKYLRGRNFCITDGGYLGSVPHGTLIGDRICILFGSTVPFVFRECSQGYFTLIGECYVHGIMDGEAMKERDMEALSRDFEIV